LTIHGPLQKERGSRNEQPGLTHQEGRNEVQLLSHAASWTGHSTAQPSMPQQFTVALRPSSANKGINAKPLHHTDALVIMAFQLQLITHYCTTFKTLINISIRVLVWLFLYKQSYSIPQHIDCQVLPKKFVF